MIFSFIWALSLGVPNRYLYYKYVAYFFDVANLLDTPLPVYTRNCIVFDIRYFIGSFNYLRSKYSHGTSNREIRSCWYHSWAEIRSFFNKLSSSL